MNARKLPWLLRHEDTILRRMLVVYGAGVAAIIGVLLALVLFFIAPRIQDLQDQETEHREEVVHQAFQAELDRLSELTRTNAAWDDAYAFAMGRVGRKFTSTNFGDEALEQIELSGVVILDAKRKVLFRSDRQGSQGEPRALSQVIEAAVGAPGLQPIGQAEVRSGLLLVGEVPSLITSAEIVRSDGSGPTAGTLVFVRPVDATMLSRLRARSHTPLALNVSSDIERSPTSVLGKVPLPDVYGASDVRLELLGTRDVLSLGQQSLASVVLIMVAILLGVAAATGRLLSQLIAAPISRLARDLKAGKAPPSPSNESPPEPTELVQLREALNSAFTHAELEAEHHRQAAALAERERAAAESANRAKSQFLATMSHELRTPLNAVIGYAEILEEDLQIDGKLTSASDAGRIRKAAKHLLGLINDVLDLAKIEAGRMELSLAPLDISSLVQDVVDQVRPMNEARGNMVVVSMPDDLVPKLADSNKLRQCLLNLMSNATKFTKDGRVELHITRTPSGLRFDVRDTGIGIGPEDIARLFQPFTQAEGAHTRGQDGTGLGLAITRRLAQLMGGDVSVSSEVGVGSTFTLTITADRADPESEPQGPCILVIDDEADARDLTRRSLAGLPFEVRAAATVSDGIAAIHRLSPALIILDIHFPDGEGWEVLAEVRRVKPETPVIVLTIDDDRSRALEAGAVEHLLKPIDRERVVDAVRRFASPAAARAA